MLTTIHIFPTSPTSFTHAFNLPLGIPAHYVDPIQRTFSPRRTAQAFANPVGLGRRDSISGSDSYESRVVRDARGNPIKQLGHSASPREMREQSALLARMREAKALTPRERAVQQAAVDLTRSSGGLDAKRLFKNFDRNKDGTINFTSFSNGLRLAGVKANHGLQRELFEQASQGRPQMAYGKFVDDMKRRASDADSKTSLPIDDPHEIQREQREENQRQRLRRLGFLRQNADEERGSVWRNKSPEERKAALLRERVMRKLLDQEDKVEAAFVSVDGQRDGKLNKTEFHEGIRRLGITLSEKDAGALFDDLPRTPDGLIDYNGFSRYLRHRSVNDHQAGQVRSTNYTKDDATAHIVQQRVADAVALKRKDLEIVFREKDQGRGPTMRSQVRSSSKLPVNVCLFPTSAPPPPPL